ncbi:MAG: beta-ketoacyl-[acyl-carrier-protein] synthase II, partial [Candidatus Omnitrophica bacterium]|nr:beta-ketoacyl-[acyl-carrier-protein] synthase II [Candidatus Omnitrophota bacterium]
MEKRVVVTGLGLISSLGNSTAANWKALCQGLSGIGPLKTFDVTQYDARIASEVKDFDPLAFGMTAKEAKRFEKFVLYALACTKQAIDDSGLDVEKEDRERIGVIVGSGIGSLRIIEEEHEVVLAKGPSRISPFLIPSLIVNEAAGHIAIDYGFMGPNACVTTACASGSHALGDALRIIQRGDADVMISGGTESCITKLGVGGFCALKALSTKNDQP